MCYALCPKRWDQRTEVFVLTKLLRFPSLVQMERYLAYSWWDIYTKEEAVNRDFMYTELTQLVETT